jgi:5'-nucleotidase
MSWILLTNDDGVDSPALLPFARALETLGEVRVVVPDRERSWVAKAITRHDPIRVDEIERDGLRMWAASGYPADAVQLGIHALFDEPPALVVSGINLGYNHGAGFLMSSGTIGATTEAWVSGVRGIAVSTGTVRDWGAWREMVHAPGSAEGWERTAELGARIVADLTEDGLGDHCDVVSVNLPFDPPEPPERRITKIARVGYDRLFRSRGGGVFVHDFGGGFVHFDTLEGTDVDAAHHDLVSVTPIRMPEAAQIPPEVAAAVTARR